MNRRLSFITFLLLVFTCAARAQETSPEATSPHSAGPDLATQAVAAQAVTNAQSSTSIQFVEHFLDSVFEIFDMPTNGNTAPRYAIAALLLVIAIVLRRVVTNIVFSQLKKLAARTTTTFDDKLFPAMEGPCASAVVVFGLFSALKALKFSPAADLAIDNGYTVAFSLVIFWGFLRALGTLLDHGHEMAQQRQMSIAAFMPWIKKTLIAVFAVVGVLIVVQSLGYDVGALLAGLGLGGLAFALAAQDTLANVFGSVVIAIDQPFKIGEAVKIGSFEGTAEDIGLRSTRLRHPAGNLVVLPNKMVASEAIVNNSRYVLRRVEQVIGLTYSTTPEKLEAIVKRIREIALAEPEIDASSVHAYFRDYAASSLDIWFAFNTTGPDFTAHMALRQRVNLAIMRAVQAGGLAFAFPTRTLELDGELAKRIAGAARQN